MQQDSPFECRFNGHLPLREERVRTKNAREDCKPSRPIVTGRKTVFWYSNSALLSNEKFGSLTIGACIQGLHVIQALHRGKTFRCG